MKGMEVNVRRARRPRILLVEEGTSVQASLADWAEVVTAAHAKDAPDLIRTLGGADCVVLEAAHSTRRALDTPRLLRELPGGHDMPICFAMRQASPELLERALSSGVDDVIILPTSQREIAERIQVLIGLWQLPGAVQLRELMKSLRAQALRRDLGQQRLTALLVHDLKSPLNAIEIVAQGVLRGGSLGAAEVEAIADIRAHSKRLASMTANLLDTAKAREGKLVPQRTSVDLVALCGDLLGEFAARARSQGVTLDVTTFTPTTTADRELLRRLLSNLLDNALHHSRAGTQVTVKISPRASGTEFRVLDEGPGIDAAWREGVFDAFEQTGEHSFRGHGLGLTFCRLVAEAHGGRIWIEDGAPGTAVCVSLPIVEVSSVEAK